MDEGHTHMYMQTIPEQNKHAKCTLQQLWEVSPDKTTLEDHNRLTYSNTIRKRWNGQSV